MNQDDFRKLLAAGGGSASGGQRQRGLNGNITSLDADGIRKLSAKKSFKKKNHKGHKDVRDTDDQKDPVHVPSSQYRDRAAERRQGIVSDTMDLDAYVNKSKSVDEDRAPTSKIKGLDFALLAQLKREKQRLEQATAAEKMKQSENAVLGVREASADVNMDAEPTFQTRLGRMVYFHACQNRPLRRDAPLTKSELFLSGRMYYIFNVLSSELESIPLAVQRSKEDCPDVDDIVSGLVDDLAISEVRRVLEEKHLSKKSRRKTEEVVNAEEKSDSNEPEDEKHNSKDTVVEDDDDDLDIFPDAGEYVPTYLREEEKPNVDIDKSSRDYFTNLSASITEAEREAKKKEQEAEDAWKETLKKAVDAQAQAEKEEAMQKRAAKLAATQDSYGEYQMEGVDDSDDDEEQGSKKRKDTKKPTEVDEEEVNRRKKQKKGNKLENDLNKINKLMEEKR